MTGGKETFIMDGVMKGMILVLMVLYITIRFRRIGGLSIDDIIVLVIGLAATKGREALED